LNRLVTRRILGARTFLSDFIQDRLRNSLKHKIEWLIQTENKDRYHGYNLMRWDNCSKGGEGGIHKQFDCFGTECCCSMVLIHL